jgi:HlyD family secretion protein
MNVQQSIKPDAEVAKTLGLGKSPARRWLSRRNLVVAALAVIVLGGLYLAFAGGSTGDAVRYVTQPAKRGALTETVTATGTVEPTNQVEVSSELSGTIREVRADYNDAVKAGDVLAVLDTDKLEAEVNHARASLAVKKAQRQEADATLAEAEQSFNRTQALTQKDFASQASREQAEAAYQRALAGVAVAKANVEVAEADLTTAETNLEKATIRSPIDGIVLSRNVEPGQTVAASLQAPVLFTIAEDLGAMQLEVDIDEADVGSVAAGQEATFSVEAFRDRRFDAKVSGVRFAPETINNVVTYTGVLSLGNSDLLLRPGMTATADIVVKRVDDALLIPNAALRFAPPATATESQSSRSGGILRMILPHPRRGSRVAKTGTAAADGTRSVYVLEDGAPKELSVVTGASDGSWTEVVSGPLEAGMPVITDSVAAK